MADDECPDLPEFGAAFITEDPAATGFPKVIVCKAVTGRSICKDCRSSIAKGSPRLGIQWGVGEANDHGNINAIAWHHVTCATLPRKTKKSDEIINFDKLSKKLQDVLLKQMGGGGGGGAGGGGGQKRGAEGDDGEGGEKKLKPEPPKKAPEIVWRDASRMTLSEIKAELGKHGYKTTGNKGELVPRLQKLYDHPFPDPSLKKLDGLLFATNRWGWLTDQLTNQGAKVEKKVSMATTHVLAEVDSKTGNVHLPGEMWVGMVKRWKAFEEMPEHVRASVLRPLPVILLDSDTYPSFEEIETAIREAEERARKLSPLPPDTKDLPLETVKERLRVLWTEKCATDAWSWNEVYRYIPPQAVPTADQQCKGGCGFFGDPTKGGLCSLCAKKQTESAQ